MKNMAVASAFVVLAGCVSRLPIAPAGAEAKVEVAKPPVAPPLGEGALELRAGASWILSWQPQGAQGKLFLRHIRPAGKESDAWHYDLSVSQFRGFLQGGEVSLGAAGALRSLSALAPKKQSDGGSVLALSVNGSGEVGSALGKESMEFKVEVRLLNLNALNLWDANPNNSQEDRLYGYDEFRPGFSNWFEPRVQEAKANSVVKALLLAGLPEVVALQELEWAQGKSEVFAVGTPLRTKLEALGYRSFLLGRQGNENFVGITTGFVSRYPLRDAEPVVFDVRVAEFFDFTEKERRSVRYSTRNIQVAELEVMGSQLRLYNNHWRSKGCSDEAGCERGERVRAANGRTLARGLAEARKKYPWADQVVLGDFNSEYTDESLALAGSSGDFAGIQSGKATSQLFNLWYELPESLRWERSFEGKKITLSQIMIDGSLFDERGFQYRPGSFEVVGQDGEAGAILSNADGEPLRWQTARLRPSEAPTEARKAIEAALEERGCARGKGHKRNCKETYFDHTGVGYFDHLPVAAVVRLTGREESARTVFELQPRAAAKPISQESCLLGKASSYPEISTLVLFQESLTKGCVRLSPAAPERLLTRGIYDSNYIMIKGIPLGFSMFNAYDPRALENGRPVSGSGSRMQDESDMCFVRKVLQREGGMVAEAVGRLGYDNGILTLYLANRSDIRLVNLPAEKQKACGGEKP